MLKMIHLRIFRRSSGFFCPNPFAELQITWHVANVEKLDGHLPGRLRLVISEASAVGWSRPIAPRVLWSPIGIRIELADGRIYYCLDTSVSIIFWKLKHLILFEAVLFCDAALVSRWICSFFVLIWFPILEPISIASKTVDNTTGTILPENHVPGSSRLVNKQANGIRWSVAIAHRRIWSLTGALQELPQSFIFGC